jgi:Ser/Thr protein kinase RdoA (MazF antagonist)
VAAGAPRAPGAVELTAPGVVEHLIRRSLVGPEAVVGSELVVTERSRRNRNFEVRVSGGPSFVVKQGVGRERRVTVANEAEISARLSRRGSPGLVRHLPRMLDYHRASGVLVHALVPGAENMVEHHVRVGRFSRALAGELGRAVGRLHSETDAASGLAPQDAPWAVGIHRPPLAALERLSGASLGLIRTLQASAEAGDALDELAARWTPRALIHGDLKWDNVLVTRRSAGSARVAIVDWELAGLGDPAWDVGSALGSLLGFWVLSVPHDEPALAADASRYPLAAMQPAARAFWHGYARAAPRSLGSDRALLDGVRWAGARLVQTGFERAQASQLPGRDMLSLVQAGINVIREPHAAAVRLLGIAPADPA